MRSSASLKMIGVTTAASVSRTIWATWSWFQPRIICSIATRSFSIFCLVGADEHEDHLRVRALDDGGPGQQPLAVEGAAERQHAALGDDRLVEVEERGLHCRRG